MLFPVSKRINEQTNADLYISILYMNVYDRCVNVRVSEQNNENHVNQCPEML